MVCKLFKVLNNPLKLMILAKVYAAKDGLNVGLLADEMSSHGLLLSGVSQYLKELEGLGVVQRGRAGRYVNYKADCSRAHHAVREIVTGVIGRMRKGDLTFAYVFPALMNPFRAKVVAALAKAGTISAAEICEKTDHQPKHLKRDLQPAVDAGLIWADDCDMALASYRYAEPSDPLVRMFVAHIS